MTRTVDEVVRREAELWFTRRLEPSVRDSEREAFEHWREKSPEHALAYAETENLWDRLAVLQRSQRLLALDCRSAPPEPGARGWRYLAAASLAAITVSTIIWLVREPDVQTFETVLGEQRMETLADGTTLRLNTSSTADVRISGNRREVMLKTGQAAFDVAKDVTRPFVVMAGDAAITAVGTSFQVRHENNTVSVTLVDGRVQLARPSHGESEWLEPGQQATFSRNAHGIVLRNVDVDALSSWTRGRMEFRSTPLEQAVEEANRYSARKIRIGDRAIARIEVSGTFRTGDIEGMVAAFEAAFPVRAEATGEGLVLFRNP